MKETAEQALLRAIIENEWAEPESKKYGQKLRESDPEIRRLLGAGHPKLAIIDAVHKPFRAFVQKPWFAKVLLRTFYLYGLGLVATVLISLFGVHWNGIADLFTGLIANTNIVAALAAGVSAIFVLWGTWYIQTNRTHDALRKFETAILINIFVTQAFLFFSYQLSAIAGLVLALILLISVRILLSETR